MTGPPVKAATAEAIEAAAQTILSGGLVGFPTDTVYGLAADATNDRAVAKVFEAKRRPADKPLLVLAADLEMAAAHGLFDTTAHRLAEALWPGPLTLVVARTPGSKLSPLINPTGTTVALRIPDNRTARAFVRAASRPLTAPSANPSGAPNPRDAAAVARGLGCSVDMVLDDGPAQELRESTLLDLTGGTARVLRAGACPIEAIRDLIGPVDGAD